MKRVLYVAAILVVLVHAPPTSAESSLELFNWLEGAWERQTTRGVLTESWRSVSDNTLEGVATLVHGDSVYISEHLRLERFGETLFYITKPAENEYPTPFKLIDHDDSRFVFDNPGHDFPKRIIYLRTGPSELTVRIEGATDGESRGIDFVFQRTKDR